MAQGDQKRVLVTGATGFIGSYLIPALLERGHSVLATDVVAEAPQLIQDTRIDYLQADLTQETDVRQLFDAGDIDWVIHLAALLAEFCEDDPARGYRVNVMGTLALLDACVANSVGRFVMTSTSGVFGRGLKEPVADDAQKVPENIYGQTKLACEHILGWYQRQKGLSVGAVRFPWVYGPGRKTGITADFSSKLLDRIARGQEVVIETPRPVGDWLYVKDAARALILLAERQDAPNTTYNIMGSVHSVAEAMEIATELYPDAKIEIRENQTFDYPYAASYDDTKAREEIGWLPDYSIRAGIKEHVETVRKEMKAV